MMKSDERSVRSDKDGDGLMRHLMMISVCKKVQQKQGKHVLWIADTQLAKLYDYFGSPLTQLYLTSVRKAAETTLWRLFSKCDDIVKFFKTIYINV